MQKGILFLIGIFFSLCVNAKTIAISYFDNSSGDAKYNALSKGIADMLITDLSKIKGVTIVEREKLEKLIQEIKLGQSKYFDPTTAQKLGKWSERSRERRHRGRRRPTGQRGHRPSRHRPPSRRDLQRKRWPAVTG